MDRREAIKKTSLLTGCALSSSAALGILKGCKPSGRPSWPTKFLSDEEVKLVSSIVDVILPRTVTPGALDVHIPEFVDLMIGDCYSKSEKDQFRKGASEFMTLVEENYSDRFETCSSEDKNKIIADEEELALKKYYSKQIKSFYLMLKELSILGFFTSERVMNGALNYNPIPGKYEGCIPITDDSRLYVDNNV